MARTHHFRSALVGLAAVAALLFVYFTNVYYTQGCGGHASCGAHGRCVGLLHDFGLASSLCECDPTLCVARFRDLLLQVVSRRFQRSCLSGGFLHIGLDSNAHRYGGVSLWYRSTDVVTFQSLRATKDWARHAVFTK